MARCIFSSIFPEGKRVNFHNTYYLYIVIFLFFLARKNVNEIIKKAFISRSPKKTTEMSAAFISIHYPVPFVFRPLISPLLNGEKIFSQNFFRHPKKIEQNKISVRLIIIRGNLKARSLIVH